MKSRVLLVILWLQLTWMKSHQKGVEQSLGSLSVPEGATASLNCNYSDSASQYFVWYRQYSGKGPELLVYLYAKGDKKEGRFSAQVDTAKQYVSLLISDSQSSDSATYLCAVRDNARIFFGTGTQLVVKPHITDPDPAVYQLKSPKSSKTSVCLFTDFDSPFNEPQSQEGTVIRSNTTVLDMRVMDSKSNGVLAWSNSTEFKCNSTFNEEFYSSSDFSCNATLIKKNFETDMNLNTRNLLVIGLRVLLLKVAGFDLFMTLRLWSR